jgi:peptide/nickel transport system substrate-binding protein
VINNYDRSEVIDPLTVKFYFKKPSPGFLQGTATIGSGLVSLSTLARNFEELGDARHIIGSGPFTVKDEKPGRELRWSRVRIISGGRKASPSRGQPISTA